MFSLYVLVGISYIYIYIDFYLFIYLYSFYYFHFRNAPLTILFCHGNGENVYMLYDYFYETSKIWNVNVFLYDYLGNSKS